MSAQDRTSDHDAAVHAYLARHLPRITTETRASRASQGLPAKVAITAPRTPTGQGRTATPPARPA